MNLPSACNHNWLDITTHADADHVSMCPRCKAVIREPISMLDKQGPPLEQIPAGVYPIAAAWICNACGGWTVLPAFGCATCQRPIPQAMLVTGQTVHAVQADLPADEPQIVQSPQ